MPLSTSIAVCTYNGERFLQEQLDSLLSQTRLPDQIVIRDDVSGDRTVEILRAFVPVAEALGISVDLQVNARNVGYRCNFDGALRACTGEVIFLCDQDDVWHADKLARMCAEFEMRPGLLALHTNARLIDGGGKVLPRSLFRSLKVGTREVRQMHQGAGLTLLFKRDMVTGATMAFRHIVLADALPLPESGWVHDAWIVTLAAMRGDVDTLDFPLVDYRLHDSNQLGLGGNDPLRPAERRQQHLQQDLSADLLTRAQQLHLPASIRALIKQKQQHITNRANLPLSRFRRIPVVLEELFAGNYQRFGRGVLSAAVDLIR